MKSVYTMIWKLLINIFAIDKHKPTPNAFQNKLVNKMKHCHSNKPFYAAPHIYIERSDLLLRFGRKSWDISGPALHWFGSTLRHCQYCRGQRSWQMSIEYGLASLEEQNLHPHFPTLSQIYWTHFL